MLRDRDAVRLAATAAELRDRHAADHVAQAVADLRDEAAIEAAFDAAFDAAFVAAALAFGGVDLLVNNAGLSVSGDIADFAAADYDRMKR